MNKIIEKCRVSTLLIYGHCLLLSSWLAAHSQCSDHAHVAIRHGGAAVPSTSIQMPAICLALQLPPRQSITKSIKRLKHAMLSVASRCRWRCRRRLSFSFSLSLCSGPETLPTVLCMCEKCSQIEAKRSRKAQGASSDVRHRPRCLWPLAVKIYLIAGYKQLLIWHKLIPSLTPPTGCQGVRQA